MMDFPIWQPFNSEWWTFVIVFLAILFLVGISEITHQLKLWTSETNRKIVHIIVGLLVSITPLIFKTSTHPAILALIFVLLNGFALASGSFEGMHSQERVSYGTVFFPLGFLITVLCFWNHPIYIIIAMIIMALADPLAAFVGQNINNPKKYIIWAETKSFEGSIAMLVSSIFLTWGLSLFFFPEKQASFHIMLAVVTGITATIAEGISYRGSDNLSVPILVILFMELFILKTESGMALEYIKGVLPIIFIFIIAYRKDSLSENGLMGGIIMGLLVFGFGGFLYLAPLFIFFILSSFLSHITNSKVLHQAKSLRRNIVQVYANGGIALLLVIMDHFNPQPWIYAAFLASVAAATADTWGTEIGRLSSKNPVDIITFQPLQMGESGGITLVGTLGSFAGATIIGITGYLFGISHILIFFIITAGFLSAIFDSIMGATVQARFIFPLTGKISEKKIINDQKGYLYTGWHGIDNDIVNIFCTSCGPCLLIIFLNYMK